MTTVPMLMLIAMLLTFYLTGGDFSPETVFVAVSLLVLIRFPLIMLPMTIGACVMGLISVRRIERFLTAGDMPRFAQSECFSLYSDQTWTWLFTLLHVAATDFCSFCTARMMTGLRHTSS